MLLNGKARLLPASFLSCLELKGRVLKYFFLLIIIASFSLNAFCSNFGQPAASMRQSHSHVWEKGMLSKAVGYGVFGVLPPL